MSPEQYNCSQGSCQTQEKVEATIEQSVTLAPADQSCKARDNRTRLSPGSRHLDEYTIVFRTSYIISNIHARSSTHTKGLQCPCDAVLELSQSCEARDSQARLPSGLWRVYKLDTAFITSYIIPNILARLATPTKGSQHPCDVMLELPQGSKARVGFAMQSWTWYRVHILRYYS